MPGGDTGVERRGIDALAYDTRRPAHRAQDGGPQRTPSIFFLIHGVSAAIDTATTTAAMPNARK